MELVKLNLRKEFKMEPDRSKLTIESLKVGLAKLTKTTYLKVQLKGLEHGIDEIEKTLIKKYGSFHFRCANCKFDIPDLEYCPYCGALFHEDKKQEDKTVKEIEEGLKELEIKKVEEEKELSKKLPFFTFIKDLLKGRDHIVKNDGSIVFQNKAKTKNIIRIYPDKIKFRWFAKFKGVKKIKEPKSYEAIYRGKDKKIIKELTKLARKKKIE